MNELFLFYIIGVVLNLWIFTDTKSWKKDSYLVTIWFALWSWAITVFALHYYQNEKK